MRLSGPEVSSSEDSVLSPSRFHRFVWSLIFSLMLLAGSMVLLGKPGLSLHEGFIGHPNELGTEIGPSDYLQIAYAHWLWTDSLTTFSHFPWEDPYQFASSAGPRNPVGWPTVLVWVPVELVFGIVVAYNVIWLLGFLLAGWAAYLLARELGLARAASAVAGFAFAYAPFRLVQAEGHVNAYLAWVLPLTLVFLERALRNEDDRQAKRGAWLFALLQVSVVASGELHLALYQSVLLVPGYALLRLRGIKRGRIRMLVGPAAAAVLGSGLFAAIIYLQVLTPSISGEGRTAQEAAYYAPQLNDLLPGGSLDERTAYPGWPTALMSLGGLVYAFFVRKWRLLALGLGVGVVVTLALAVGPGLDEFPRLQEVARALPLFSFIRVPGRIVIVTALLLAILAAIGVDAIRAQALRLGVAGLAIPLILLAAPKHLYATNPVSHSALEDVPSDGVLLNLPAFDPGHSTGSVYSFMIIGRPGPIVGGYSVLATAEGEEDSLSTQPLSVAPIDQCLWEERVNELDILYVALHLDLYGERGLLWDGDPGNLAREMNSLPAFEFVSERSQVRVYKLHRNDFECTP